MTVWASALPEALRSANPTRPHLASLNICLSFFVSIEAEEIGEMRREICDGGHKLVDGSNAKAPGGGNLGLGVAGFKERCVRGIGLRPFDVRRIG